MKQTGRLKLQVSISDRMTFGDRQTTADGYLATVCKLARSGCYEYLGRELGRPDLDRVTVYRDNAEVFDEDSLRSFAYKPVTDDHPPVGVNSRNWSKYAKGQLGGKALRDGEHIEFPLVVMDQGLIDKINSGKVEVSAGYTADITFEDNIAPDGTPYQARMTNIVGNHCAVVEKGRAITARLGDAWPMDTSTPSPPPKKETRMSTLMLDGLKVDLSDAEAVTAAVNKLTDAKTKAEAATATALADKATAEAAVATAAASHVTAIEAKDAEIATLTATNATLTTQLADARDPAKLRDAAAEYASTVTKAKALGATVADADSVATVKRNAVNAKLGDVAKDWTDAQVDVSFATLTAGVKDATPDPLRETLGNRQVVDFADAAAKSKAARDAMIAGFNKRDAK